MVDLQSLQEAIAVLEVFEMGLGMDQQTVDAGSDKGKVICDGLQEPLETRCSSSKVGPVGFLGLKLVV
jgi:hypothetical protein